MKMIERSSPLHTHVQILSVTKFFHGSFFLVHLCLEWLPWKPRTKRCEAKPTKANEELNVYWDRPEKCFKCGWSNTSHYGIKLNMSSSLPGHLLWFIIAQETRTYRKQTDMQITIIFNSLHTPIMFRFVLRYLLVCERIAVAKSRRGLRFGSNLT